MMKYPKILYIAVVVSLACIVLFFRDDMKDFRSFITYSLYNSTYGSNTQTNKTPNSQKSGEVIRNNTQTNRTPKSQKSGDIIHNNTLTNRTPKSQKSGDIIHNNTLINRTLKSQKSGDIIHNNTQTNRTQNSQKSGEIIHNNTIHTFSDKEILQLKKGSAMEDKRLVEFIKQRWLVYPKKVNKVFPGQERHFSQAGQSKFIDEFLKGKRNGFYVDSGAADGEALSNSVFFERYRNWTGLLVEPNPSFFNGLRAKRPKSYAINACLSTTNKSDTVMFDMDSVLGKIANSSKKGRLRKVQCFPLYSILQAVGVTTIDLFSLDVEGPELDVLKTIPWQKVRINVLTIEYRILFGVPKETATPTMVRLKQLRDFFQGLGYYKEVGYLPPGAVETGLDVVFARKDIP